MPHDDSYCFDWCLDVFAATLAREVKSQASDLINGQWNDPMQHSICENKAKSIHV